MACAASTDLLDRAWRIAPQVALRPEPFGALVYHFGTRRLTFLKSRQRSSGSFNAKQLYGEAIATMALCEAYGMTQDPALKKSAQMGIDYLVFDFPEADVPGMLRIMESFVNRVKPSCP